MKRHLNQRFTQLDDDNVAEIAEQIGKPEAVLRQLLTEYKSIGLYPIQIPLPQPERFFTCEGRLPSG